MRHSRKNGLPAGRQSAPHEGDAGMSGQGKIISDGTPLGTRIVIDGVERKGYTRARWEIAVGAVAVGSVSDCIELFFDVIEADLIGGMKHFCVHPITGKIEEVDAIVFADGTMVELSSGRTVNVVRD